ncbi:hypothetical protein AURDEDRAFT_178286 [Auricularia subglabra TFB-10046 SS5]|uniref:Zn(2)-C6 fungal-type domain-containing protein n=1 Tax=Auricularia subglabra (strain TFB-10046 / SS5) TaxID=717982 RepID=J0CQW8_AURST|nr:hypothetical protein AURDEDRAFT_178286 [Auricularia subglabra TFB-10046 SS5]
MGQRAVLDVSSPPKAASSAAERAVSSESSRSPTPSPSPSPSPAPAGEASSSVVSGPGPGAAVAAPVPPGGIVPPTPPFIAPAGGFGPPSFLVAPPPVPAPTAVAPARSPEGGDAHGVVEAAAPPTVGVDAEGRDPSPESAPPPPGAMTWAQLQAELLGVAANLVGPQHLGLLPWPVGEPSYKRIERWRLALETAVEHFDMLSLSLRSGTRLRGLVVTLRDRYGRQLLFANEGVGALRRNVNLEPEVCRTSPPGPSTSASSGTAGRHVCEVILPRAPSSWVGTPARRPSPPTSTRKRSRPDPAVAGPSAAKRRKKVPSPPTRPSPAPSDRASPAPDGYVWVHEPCARCVERDVDCVPHATRRACERCAAIHAQCSWASEEREARRAGPVTPRRRQPSSTAVRGRGGGRRSRRHQTRSPPAPMMAPPAGSWIPGGAAGGQPVLAITPAELSAVAVDAARLGSSLALERAAHLAAPRSAMRTPAAQRVRFGSPMDTSALAGESSSRPPTEPPSTPGSRREGPAEEEEEEDAGQGGSKDASQGL